MTTHHAVGIPVEALADLDRLVGEALREGRRPWGRRPCRGSIIAELIHAAANPPAPAREPAPPRGGKIDVRAGLATRGGGR